MNTNGKVILALDASSRNVGWCLAQGDRYLNSGVYRPQGDTDERVREIAAWTNRSISVLDPDVVAIETSAGSHQNLKTDRLLARVCGNIEGICAVNGIFVLYVHPMKVKTTGFHKHATIATGRFIGKEHVGPDESDAVGVWQAALGEIQAREFEDLVEREERE